MRTTDRDLPFLCRILRGCTASCTPPFLASCVVLQYPGQALQLAVEVRYSTVGSRPTEGPRSGRAANHKSPDLDECVNSRAIEGG